MVVDHSSEVGKAGYSFLTPTYCNRQQPSRGYSWQRIRTYAFYSLLYAVLLTLSISRREA